MTDLKSETYEVLARKYRPRQFADVVGQQHVTKTLANALTTRRIAHAYLFVGPRGIGKTSISRIFAKALNCRQGPTPTPCDACDSCLEITGGRSLDVMEIDGASNNSVDDVRELRDAVRYTPARGPFKIYVIDEVHMLSMSAFNALLKTLEEPPPHVKFIFATTEPQKLPATIASRCQRFDLRRITARDLIEQLRFIAGKENITVEEDALLAIARGAEGGMRDAESAFDQLISFCGSPIRESDVLSVFGLVSRQELESLARAILTGDISIILSTLSNLDRGGKDLQRVVLELLEHFRNVLVLQQGVDAGQALGLPDSQMNTLRDHADQIEPSHLLRIVELLIETESRLRFSLSRRTLLDTSLIRCARVASSVSIEAVLRQLSALRQSLGLPDSNPPIPPPPAKKSTPLSQPTPPARPAPVQPADPDEDADDGEETSPTEFSGTGVVPTDGESLAADWPRITGELRSVVLKLGTLLHGSRILKIGQDFVEIGVDPARVPDLANAMDSRGQLAVEQALSRKLNRSVSARLVHAVPLAAAAPAALAGPGATAHPTIAPAGPMDPKTPKKSESVLNHPDAHKVINLFGGSLVDDSPK